MHSEEWDARYSVADSVWSAQPNQFVVEYLSHLSPGAMADIAGGEGRNALWFASRGWQAEDIDFSAVAVQRALEWARDAGVADTFAAQVADVTETYPAKFAPLDLAVIAYLQLPAPKLAQAIRQAATLLKPGGTFFGVWHARENLAEGFGGPQNAAVLPTRDELLTAATAAQLSVKSLELRDRHVVHDGVEVTAIDVVLVANLS